LHCLPISFIVHGSKLSAEARAARIMKASWFFTGLVMWAWAMPVAAQPAARMTLSWSAPPGCPTTEDVQARVDALLGTASASSVADVRASGQVERTDGGFRLLLSMAVGDAPSSRIIEARTCDELAGAGAIAIALLARSTLAEGGNASDADISAGSSASEPASGSSNAPSTAEHSKPDGTSSSSEPASELSPNQVRFVIDAPIAVAGWGSMPATSLGFGAALGLRWRLLRVVVGGVLWLPQTDQVSGFATRFNLQSARLELCVAHNIQGLELAPCVGAAAEREGAKGLASEVFTARSRTALWGAGVVGVFASLPAGGLRHLRFLGEARAQVSPVRPRFVIDQLGPVHEPALVTAQLDLGFEWIF
jgi:hypothetical protein